MILLISFVVLTVYGSLANENSENSLGPILQKIDTLNDEVQYLKRENANKELRIQILDGKVNVFQLESQIQKETITKLTNEVEILKNQTNEIATNIQEQNDQLQEHQLVFHSKF